MKSDDNPPLQLPLPADAEYPWHSDGDKVFGYCEPPLDIDPEDVPDQRPVAVASTSNVASMIAAAVNHWFRTGNQR
jgi:hypothetical protein